MISSLCGGEFASKKSASVKRFLPRFLGVWLTINGFAYVTISFTGVLLPQYQDKVFSMSFPALLGELAIMLWLWWSREPNRNRWTPQPYRRRLPRVRLVRVNGHLYSGWAQRLAHREA